MTKLSVQQLANAYLANCDKNLLPIFGPSLANMWLNGEKQEVAKLLADPINRFFKDFWFTRFCLVFGNNSPEVYELFYYLADERINQYMERFR